MFNQTVRKNLLTRVFAAVVFAAVILVVSSGPIFGQTTDDVSVTVTLQNVSVTVSDGTVAYGTLGTSAQEDTTSNGINDSQTATNNGNVTADFNIRGSDTAAWTLEAAPGADQYSHEFCTSNCDASPTWNDLDTPAYNTLSSGVTASSSQVFDLQISTPTSTSSFLEQQADVTVQAVAS